MLHAYWNVSWLFVELVVAGMVSNKNTYALHMVVGYMQLFVMSVCVLEIIYQI